MTDSKLAKLKADYRKLQEKYKLPDYKLLNEEFDVEKVQEQETDTLLREMRKVIMDKAIAYLRFVELLLNPSNAPMFFFAMLKGMESADKKILEEIYSRLGKLEVEVIDVDNDYSEKAEAEFISRVYNEWQEIKEDMRKVSKALKRSWDRKSEKKEKGYLS